MKMSDYSEVHGECLEFVIYLSQDESPWFLAEFFPIYMSMTLCKSIQPDTAGFTTSLV